MSEKERMTNMEEEIAHLSKVNEELSGEILAQWKRIEGLENAIKVLENRLSGFEDSFENPDVNERPPHW